MTRITLQCDCKRAERETISNMWMGVIKGKGDKQNRGAQESRDKSNGPARIKLSKSS